MCGKLFQHKGVLNKHIRTIHDEKKTKSQKEKRKRTGKKSTVRHDDGKGDSQMVHHQQQPLQTIQVDHYILLRSKKFFCKGQPFHILILRCNWRVVRVAIQSVLVCLASWLDKSGSQVKDWLWCRLVAIHRVQSSCLAQLLEGSNSS